MIKKVAALSTVFVGAIYLLSHMAMGAHLYSASLSSTDAGQTNTVTLSKQVDYALDCANPACYKVSTTSTVAVNCATDYILRGKVSSYGQNHALNVVGDDAGQTMVVGEAYPTIFEAQVESGSAIAIAAKALDAGDPSCKLYQVSHNPPKIQ